MTARTHSEDMRVPRGALIAAALVMAASMAAAIAGRTGLIDRVAVPVSAPAEERVLRFLQNEDGSVAVHDLGEGRLAGLVPASDAGFINGVLRGLRHERRVAGVPAESPYRLIWTKAGRLVLVDPSIDRRIELLGFGDTNFDAFRRLMTLGRETT